MLWRRKWQPTPVFLPGESQGRGSHQAAGGLLSLGSHRVGHDWSDLAAAAAAVLLDLIFFLFKNYEVKIHKTSIYSLTCLYKKIICVPPPWKSLTSHPHHNYFLPQRGEYCSFFFGWYFFTFLNGFPPYACISRKLCLFCHFEEYMVDILHLFFCIASFFSITFIRFTQIIEYMCN